MWMISFYIGLKLILIVFVLNLEFSTKVLLVYIPRAPSAVLVLASTSTMYYDDSTIIDHSTPSTCTCTIGSTMIVL